MENFSTTCKLINELQLIVYIGSFPYVYKKLSEDALSSESKGKIH